MKELSFSFIAMTSYKNKCFNNNDNISMNISIKMITYRRNISIKNDNLSTNVSIKMTT